MTPYIVVFMISIGLFALSDRVKYTQRKPIVFISVMALCLLAGMRAVGVGTDTRVYLMPVYEAAKRSHSIGEYLNSSFHAFTWTTEGYGTIVSVISFDCNKNYRFIILRSNYTGIMCDSATICCR